MLGLSKARKEAARRESESRSKKYTKPALRERIKSRIMAGSKGGNPGQWSARKSQMLVQQYEKAGGGYRGGKGSKQKSLSSWTKQKWQYSGKGKGKGVYLPEDKIKRLKRTAAGRERLRVAAEKKAKATREGKQYARHGLAAGTSKKRA